jgi:hypothetical protein
MEIFDTFSDLPSADYFTYPLEWLDLTVNYSLNPAKANVQNLDDDQINQILHILPKEEAKIQLLIHKQTFSVTDEKSLRIIIERYYSSLIMLLDTTHRYSMEVKKGNVDVVYKLMIETIGQLLSFLEGGFEKYLPKDIKVPITYLSLSRSELVRRIKKLKKRADRYENLQPLKAIIFESLYKFTIPEQDAFEITFRSLFYNKELVRRLESIIWDDTERIVLENINDVLFFMNFNSRSYINFVVKIVTDDVKQQTLNSEALKRLHYYKKSFKQLHRHPEMKLNPEYNDLETVLQTWIDSEIKYLEEKGKLDENNVEQTLVRQKVQAPEVKTEDKIRCSLSSDQTGLILRAADELRILVARSMTEVFRSIVPYLATPHNDNLSYNGMRSKSYVPEEKDKEKAIEALERMIKKIKDY